MKDRRKDIVDFEIVDPDTQMKYVISVNIRKYREEKGLTQTELGEKFGKAKTTVASWEGGKSLPDAELLYRIARFLGRSIEDMYHLKKIE